jgi:LmbE family N-acetylglucosaminyl deacetylase
MVRGPTSAVQTIANRVRSAFARRFLLTLRRATHRLPVQLETLRRQRVLVIAPHMDDEVIGCGGALLLHRALHSEVRVVFVSDSSGAVDDPVRAERLRGIRRAEMLQVKDTLALASVVELGFTDGSLMSHEEAIASRLADELRTFQPTQVLCPFPGDGHSDHQSSAFAFGTGSQLADWHGEVLAYEVWSTLWPNMAVDIGAVADEKARLIRMYASEMSDRDYAAAVLGLNRYRGMQHRVESAEAFHRCDAAQFRALTACLDSFDSQTGELDEARPPKRVAKPVIE